MEGRIARDRGRGADWRGDTGTSVADDDAVAREVLRVVRDLVHELMRERRPHAAVAVGVGDRAAAIAQLVPNGMSVGVVRRVSVVEVGRPVREPVRHKRHSAASTMEIAYSGQFPIASRALSSSSGGTVPSPRTIAFPYSSTSKSSGANA